MPNEDPTIRAIQIMKDAQLVLDTLHEVEALIRQKVNRIPASASLTNQLLMSILKSIDNQANSVVTFRNLTFKSLPPDVKEDVRHFLRK